MQKILLTLMLVSLPAFAKIGDRLALEINSIPYTQRQVESYLVAKTSITRNVGIAGNAFDLTDQDWPQALTVFTDDMVILQEAQRLGSFHPADALVNEALGIVKDKLPLTADMKSAIERLDLDDRTLARNLSYVLRVEAFRRSKNRQTTTVRDPNAPSVVMAQKPRWLVDLTSRSVVRQFKGIHPYQRYAAPLRAPAAIDVTQPVKVIEPVTPTGSRP